jgi:GNAT superfamily N-acetyltransferase
MAEALRIEPAREGDVDVLLDLICQLAAYEKLTHMVSATPQGLRAALFGERPVAEAIIGYEGEIPKGFALFFHNFSTFLGKPGIWLEDLFVVPQARGKGYGKALFSYVGNLAKQRGCGRFEWAVLDWNEPSIDFYKRFGAVPLDDWTIFRVTGEALQRFDSGDHPAG